MRNQRMCMRGLVLTGAFSLLLYAAFAQGVKSPSSPIRLLYPVDKSVILCAKPVMVMAAAPKSTVKVNATLDGKPVILSKLTFAPEWTTSGKLKKTDALVGNRGATAIFAAEVTLTPGAHVLTVGGNKLKLKGVSEPVTAAPAGFAIGYSHLHLSHEAGKLDCNVCHQSTGKILTEPVTPATCVCHNEKRIEEVHSHVPQALSRCSMCHDPHGTVRDKLLTNTKAVLCTQCHAAGHIKPAGK